MQGMEFLSKPPTNRSSALLSGNDNSMIFPILSGVLAVYYYCNRQDSLVQAYREHQSSSSYRAKVVASIPLRYPDSHDGLFNYRAVTHSRRDERSQAIKRMVEVMSQAKFQGRFEESTAVDKEAAGTARANRLKGKDSGERWLWAKRYAATSAFADEKPEARYLPIACLLTVHGGKIFHGGLVKLVVESDTDLLLTPPEDTAMKVYGTLRDTNWRNLGSGQPQDVHFVYTQDNQQIADLAWLDKPLDQGGVKIGRVASLALHLTDEPVAFATDALGLIQAKGLSLEANSDSRSLRLVSQEAGLLFALRSLSSIMPLGYKPEKCGDAYCLTVEPRKGGVLPLRLRIDKEGDLVEVDRVVLTGTEAFPGAPREGGGLEMSTVGLKGVMLFTKKGVLYQDTAGADWKVKEGEIALGPSTRLDLLVFDSAVDIGETSGAVRQSEPFATDFKTSRYRMDVTVDEERYNKTRRQGMRGNSPETERSRVPEQGRGSWVSTVAVASIFAAVALFSWLRPNKTLAYNLGRLAVLCGFVLSVLSLVSFLALKTDWFPWWHKNQDDTLFYASIVVAGVSALAVTVSLRFTRSVPAGVYVMGSLLMLSVTMIRSMPLENASELTEEVRSWRSSLLLLAYNAGTLLAWEAFKMGGKAIATHETPPVTTGLRRPQGGLLFFVLLFYPLYKMLLNADDTECEAGDMRLEWLRQEVEAGSNVDANLREIAALENRLCLSVPSKVSEASGKALGVVVTAAILLYFIGAPVLQRKLMPSAGFVSVEAKTYESARALRYALVALDLFPLLAMAYILLPRLSLEPSPVCAAMQKSNDEFTRQYGNDEGYVFFDTPQKATTVQSGLISEGCVSAETRAMIGVACALAVLWLVSLVKPPRYSISSRQASGLELSLFVVFVTGQAALFSYLKERGQELHALLETDATAVLATITDILRPP